MKKIGNTLDDLQKALEASKEQSAETSTAPVPTEAEEEVKADVPEQAQAVTETKTAAELIKAFKEARSAASGQPSLPMGAEASPEDATAFVEDTERRIQELQEMVVPLKIQLGRNLKKGDRGYIDPVAVRKEVDRCEREMKELRVQQKIVQDGIPDFVLYQARRNMQADRIQEAREEIVKVRKTFGDPKVRVDAVKAVCDLACSLQLVEKTSAGPVSLKIFREEGFGEDGQRIGREEWHFYSPAGFGKDAEEFFAELKGFVDEFFRVRKERYDARAKALAPYTISTDRNAAGGSELDKIKSQPRTARNLVLFVQDGKGAAYDRCLFPLCGREGQFLGEALLERSGQKIGVTKGTKNAPREILFWAERKLRVSVVVKQKADLPDEALEEGAYDEVNKLFDLSGVTPAGLQESLRRKLHGDLNFLVVQKKKDRLRDVSAITDVRTMSELRGGSVGTTPFSLEWTERDDRGQYDVHLDFHLVSDGKKFWISDFVPGTFDDVPWLEDFTVPSDLSVLNEPKWRAVLERNSFHERAWVLRKQMAARGASYLTKDTIALVTDAEGSQEGCIGVSYEGYEKRGDSGVYIPQAYVVFRSGRTVRVEWAMQGRSEKEVGDAIRQDQDIASLSRAVRFICLKAWAKALNLKGKDAWANAPAHLKPEEDAPKPAATPANETAPAAPVPEETPPSIPTPPALQPEAETTTTKKPRRSSRKTVTA